MNMPSAEFSTSVPPSNESDPQGSNSQSIGGTVLMKALADEQVEFIWGYPGGSVLYIYDELYKQDKIQHDANKVIFWPVLKLQVNISF